MKRVPVLALCGIAAVSLMAGNAISATIEANDTPDVILKAGPDGTAAGANAFDLDDFFKSDDGAAVDVSINGAAATKDGNNVVSLYSEAT
ncbi:MAG: hypothetical protein GC154_11050, partial [bacterium]|nr:hypothetical protein [bacterium]